MAGNKVELCGVNTAKLPLLKEEEKEELLQGSRRGRRSKRTVYQGEFKTGTQCDQTIFIQQRKCR